MAYLEELLPEFRKGAKIRQTDWDVDVRIYFDNDQIYWQDNGSWKNGKLASTKDLVSLFTFHEDNWEIYNEERAYWDTIIKNKCLCWFWDFDFSSRLLGNLKEVRKSEEYKFSMVTPANYVNHVCFINCRPVHRNEITFYEDRENEI